MNILQTFVDIENYDICTKIYSYFGAHQIVQCTELDTVIKRWVYDQYGGNFSLKDCSQSEFHDYYYDEATVLREYTELFNFSKFYFKKHLNDYYEFDEFEYDIYLENATEEYLTREIDSDTDLIYTYLTLEIDSDSDDSSYF